jgi:hypothetical protein
MEFLTFFNFLWVIFAFLDAGLRIQSESGPARNTERCPRTGIE